MFCRKLRLKDIKVIITDKSLKWLDKFDDMMGGTKKKAYKYYYNFMKRFDDFFSIVKTAHPSHWGDLQLMAYQMDNSVPTTDKEVLTRIAECGVNFCNGLKNSDTAYLEYLNKTSNKFNINELLIELVKWNLDFAKTEFFRTKKSKDIGDFVKDCKEGRLPQVGDNLKEEGAITFETGGVVVSLAEEDLLIETAQKAGFVTESDGQMSVVLDTNLTPELIEEGFVYEIISKIQTMRKEAGFEVMDHIAVAINGNGKIAEIVNANKEAISEKVLADEILTDKELAVCKEWNVNGEKVTVGVEKK